MISKIHNAIRSLICNDISNLSRVSFWLLACRSIGLNLGISNDDQDMSTNATPNDLNGEIEMMEEEISPTQSVSVDIANLNSSQFVSRYKDAVTQLYHTLPPSRLSMKVFTMECANVIIQHFYNYLRNADSYSGTHLSHAIQVIKDLISRRELKTSITSSEILEILQEDVSNPLVVVFMHDLINYGCALASYTLNDQRLLTHQTQGIQFLQQVIDIFQISSDLDVNTNTTSTSSTSPMESKLLHQYVSQVISTIKTSLSEVFSNELLLSCGKIIVTLLKQGYLVDKILLKRLLKPLLSYLSLFQWNKETQDKILLIDSYQQDVLKYRLDDTMASFQLAILSQITSELYILAFPCPSHDDNISNDIRQEIRNIFHDEVISRSCELSWNYIQQDSFRFVLYKNMISLKDDKANQINCKDDPWTLESLNIDLFRGGHSFRFGMNLMEAEKVYQEDLFLKLSHALVLYYQCQVSKHQNSDIFLAIQRNCRQLLLCTCVLLRFNRNLPILLEILQGIYLVFSKMKEMLTIDDIWLRVLRQLILFHHQELRDKQEVLFVYRSWLRLIKILVNMNLILHRDQFLVVWMSCLCILESLYPRLIEVMEILPLLQVHQQYDVSTNDVNILYEDIIDVFQCLIHQIQSNQLEDMGDYIHVMLMISFSLYIQYEHHQHVHDKLLVFIHNQSIENISWFCNYILDEMKRHVDYIIRHETNKDFIPMESYFSLWVEVIQQANDKERQRQCHSPIQLIAILVSYPQYPLHYQLQLHKTWQVIAKTIQNPHLEMSIVLMLSSLLTPLALVLIKYTLIDSNEKKNDLQLVLIQNLFIYYNRLREYEQQVSYLIFILPCLCEVFQLHPMLQTISSQFAAKALTFIVRNQSNVMRVVVMQLDEIHKGYLQNAMKISMSYQETSNTSTSSSNNTTNTSNNSNSLIHSNEISSHQMTFTSTTTTSMAFLSKYQK